MNQYKLSIIAIVYNSEKYIQKCLDTLINQTLDNIEIICVDDGSKDSSPHILDNYAQKYPEKIKAFHKENGGEFSSKNYGLEKATGEYITFVNTDDYIEKNWAEKLYTAASDNDADMAVCGFEKIDLTTHKVISKYIPKYTVKEVSSKDDFIAFLNPEQCNKIYKREKIEDLKFLPLREFDDVMFLASSFIRIDKIAFVSEILYYDYVENSLQKTNIDEQDVNKFKKYLLEVKELYVKENKYIDMGPILEKMAFIHLAKNIMCRISYIPYIDMKQKTTETAQYFNINYPGWKKNKFFKLGYSITRGSKHIGIWWIAQLYKIGIPTIYINVHRFIENMKKNIDKNMRF